MGLITRVVDDGQVDATADEIAGKLAGLPPVALRETKRLMREPLALQVKKQMDAEVSAFTQRLASDEFRAAAMKLLTRS